MARKKQTAEKKFGYSGVRYPDEVKARAVELAQDDVPVAEIRRELGGDEGPSEKTIRSWLDAVGVATPGNQRIYDRAQILKDLNGGSMSPTEVCDKHGCSRTYLMRLRNGDIKP